jgi:hypothetical protein
MFIGFIAVIVVLLIIVAIMASGTTTTSGGIDQTKAMKLVSELGNIGASLGFYKTVNLSGDMGTYTGITQQLADDAGIVTLNADGMIPSAAIPAYNYAVQAGDFEATTDADGNTLTMNDVVILVSKIATKNVTDELRDAVLQATKANLDRCTPATAPADATTDFAVFF